MNRSTVAVMIASWNRSSDLRLALEAISASEGPTPEVIVVDNASTDDAAEVAASFPVKLIRNTENVGFAAAMEQALRQTGADYVALVNNDALLARDWCAGMAAFLDAHPEAAAVGGKQYFWDDDAAWDTNNHYYAYTTVDARAGTTTAHVDAADDLREVATLSGAAVMVRRAAIDDVGAPFLDRCSSRTTRKPTSSRARSARAGSSTTAASPGASIASALRRRRSRIGTSFDAPEPRDLGASQLRRLFARARRRPRAEGGAARPLRLRGRGARTARRVDLGEEERPAPP